MDCNLLQWNTIKLKQVIGLKTKKINVSTEKKTKNQ